MVTWVALADVVEERAHQQKVRSRHPPDEGRRLSGGFEQVPVDGEAVVGVALGLVAHRRPLGQEPDEDAVLVEGLDGGDRRSAGAEHGDQCLAGPLGPRVTGGRCLAGQPVERGSGQRHAQPGRRLCRPEGQRRVARGVGVGGQRDLAVAEGEAVADGSIAPGAAALGAPEP